MAKHSRDNEREADKVGLDFLIKAGYDPTQAPKIWENIIKEMELGDVNKPLTFLASHPAPEERIENLKKQQAELTLAENIVQFHVNQYYKKSQYQQKPESYNHEMHSTQLDH